VKDLRGWEIQTIGLPWQQEEASPYHKIRNQTLHYPPTPRFFAMLRMTIVETSLRGVNVSEQRGNLALVILNEVKDLKGREV